MPEPFPILTSRYLTDAQRARAEARDRAEISLDLGLSEVGAGVSPEGIILPEGQRVAWRDIDTMEKDTTGCYLVEGNVARKIHAFSEEFHRDYSLFATDGAPTLINSGFTMHRIVGVDPWQDTQRKIEALAPLHGRVLDTATGLGYTAIREAETALHVVTVELDPLVLDIARLNPWSRGLFDDSRITQIVGDVYERIDDFQDGEFARIMHDPPAFNLAGELYSGQFYQDLYRVLAPGGRMFHYVGDLQSGYGRRYMPGIIRRLREAGFSRVTPKPDAYGLLVYKS